MNDNQSKLTDLDVQLLNLILDHAYHAAIANKNRSWTAGYDWEKRYLGAGSTLSEGDFSVMLWGGLVRARKMNFSALSSIVCHD